VYIFFVMLYNVTRKDPEPVVHLSTLLILLDKHSHTPVPQHFVAMLSAFLLSNHRHCIALLYSAFMGTQFLAQYPRPYISVLYPTGMYMKRTKVVKLCHRPKGLSKEEIDRSHISHILYDRK